MSKYRASLPQLNGGFFLTDGGAETTFLFDKGFELPHFALFDLMRNPLGRAAIEEYFRNYAAIAQKFNAGFILEAPTWRANKDWGDRLDYTPETLKAANLELITLMEKIRGDLEAEQPFVISGCLGPRGDGYAIDDAMTAAQAKDYHQEQINTFAESNADFVSAFTMNYVDEVIGVVLAAQQATIPVVIFFTVETDGKLPSGETLENAIKAVDDATKSYTAYYGINCAHPIHFRDVFQSNSDAAWIQRIRGLRANASKMSHEELDSAPELDIGNPMELGADHTEILKQLPHINILGGCCGTDERHIEQIAVACRPYFN
ncbi:homocysteine S-methyltransferase [[Leptolyngbya] sp. PCC 7376]|uniref:homocysteine S-methyltransferase family protein n=1 Tax=[Leptolyngbya] sp. PCC 7376 TaxID=111781 RepID=UPI00029F0EB6|nr:homocysteine S-methyltransferase family protein [[Leptolyngbya] sp. PCC 7376]AFY38988.1 homocysteine S-methyltransferase [[Leptolyngbya] sp. PCC 7376]